jgi:hypothetical protein
VSETEYIYADLVREIVDAAPPFSPEVRSRLAILLRPGPEGGATARTGGSVSTPSTEEMPVVTFLKARLDEREAQARSDIDHFGQGPGAPAVTPADAWIEKTANEVLADIAAVRKVIEWCSDWTRDEFEVMPVIYALAERYDQHSEYEQDWKKRA